MFKEKFGIEIEFTGITVEQSAMLVIITTQKL